MNIVVCVKQVPDTAEVRIDPVTNTLVRQGVPSILNPFDKQALETALLLKDTNGGKVVVLSMGPPQATDVLKEAIAMGADEAVLLSDRAFAGADTLATSYTLAKAIEKLAPVDLVLCGKQAIDGDTAQVGPEIAAHLDWAQVTYAVNVKEENNVLRIDREYEDCSQIITGSVPMVITVTRAAKEPRFASIKGKMRANRTSITTWSAADLDADKNKIGLNGSPTQVSRIFSPTMPQAKGEVLVGMGAEEAAKTLVDKLVAAKIIG